jgi:hypothetical protein
LSLLLIAVLVADVKIDRSVCFMKKKAREVGMLEVAGVPSKKKRSGNRKVMVRKTSRWYFES